MCQLLPSLLYLITSAQALQGKHSHPDFMLAVRPARVVHGWLANVTTVSEHLNACQTRVLHDQSDSEELLKTSSQSFIYVSSDGLTVDTNSTLHSSCTSADSSSLQSALRCPGLGECSMTKLRDMTCWCAVNCLDSMQLITGWQMLPSLLAAVLQMIPQSGSAGQRPIGSRFARCPLG
jgi:hypothetical protein